MSKSMKPTDQSTANHAKVVRKSESAEPWSLPFSKEDWEKTPVAVRLFIAAQQKTIETLTKRVEQLEQRLNRNSSNSNQPPSSDSPYRKGKDDGAKKRTPPKKEAWPRIPATIPRSHRYTFHPSRAMPVRLPRI